MQAFDQISPAELTADILNRLGWAGQLIAHGAVVGPTNDTQQQEGVAAIMAAGLPVVEKYVPIIWMRAQVRCLHGNLADVDTIGQVIQDDLHQRGRTVARMASTGRRYLVHQVNVTAGRSMHFDSPETWETLLFAELLIGTDPLD